MKNIKEFGLDYDSLPDLIEYLEDFAGGSGRMLFHNLTETIKCNDLILEKSSGIIPGKWVIGTEKNDSDLLWFTSSSLIEESITMDILPKKFNKIELQKFLKNNMRSYYEATRPDIKNVKKKSKIYRFSLTLFCHYFYKNACFS